MTRFLAVLFLLFSNSVLAQVTAPDYKDASKWNYHSGDIEVLQPVDQNYSVWHEHYTPVVIPDEAQELLVVFKPVKTEVFEKDGEDKFAEISREQPWLLLHTMTNAANDHSFHLFEYESGSWKYIKTFSQERETLEFLSKEYGLRS